MPSELWENAMSILPDSGDVLLIDSADLRAIQALASIPQLINELQTSGHLEEHSGLSPNCLEHAQEAGILIFQEISMKSS